MAEVVVTFCLRMITCVAYQQAVRKSFKLWYRLRKRRSFARSTRFRTLPPRYGNSRSAPIVAACCSYDRNHCCIVLASGSRLMSAVPHLINANLWAHPCVYTGVSPDMVLLNHICALNDLYKYADCCVAKRRSNILLSNQNENTDWMSTVACYWSVVVFLCLVYNNIDSCNWEERFDGRASCFERCLR